MVSFYYLAEVHFIQYPEGHVSRSIYAIFRMVSATPTSSGLLEEFFPNLFLAIWTTTPWTVPANAGELLAVTLLYIDPSIYIRGSSFMFILQEL